MIISLMKKTSGSNSKNTAGLSSRNFRSLNNKTQKWSIPTTHWSPAWKTSTTKSSLQNKPSASHPVKNWFARTKSSQKSQKLLPSNNKTTKWSKKSQTFKFSWMNSRTNSSLTSSKSNTSLNSSKIKIMNWTFTRARICAKAHRPFWIVLISLTSMKICLKVITTPVTEDRLKVLSSVTKSQWENLPFLSPVSIQMGCVNSLMRRFLVKSPILISNFSHLITFSKIAHQNSMLMASTFLNSVS